MKCLTQEHNAKTLDHVQCGVHYYPLGYFTSYENKLESNVFLFAFRFERIPLKLHGNDIFVLDYKSVIQLQALLQFCKKWFCFINFQGLLTLFSCSTTFSGLLVA